MKFGFKSQLAVDLGTSSIRVFVPGRGVVSNEPSVVALTRSTGAVEAVGQEAHEMMGREPDDLVIKRALKDGVITDYHVTEAILRHVYDISLGKWQIFKPEVLLSVSAGSSSTQRRALIESAYTAGARSAYVMKSPVLAALGAGVPIHEPGGYLIVDIGGGTTDIAVTSLGGIVASASLLSAGTQLDSSIAEYVKRTYNISIGERSAEQIKIDIGTVAENPQKKSAKITGVEILSGLPQTIELDSKEISKVLLGELKDVTQAIRKVLHSTPPELAADIVDHGILLSGGTALLPGLPELLLEETGVPARVVEKPLESTVIGAGAALEHLNLYKRSLIS
ncbi:MAG: rod shape-determining protein [Candidatus Paceibacterota bacterium]